MSGRVDIVLAEGLRSPEVGCFVVIGDDPRPVPGCVIAGWIPSMTTWWRGWPRCSPPKCAKGRPEGRPTQGGIP